MSETETRPNHLLLLVCAIGGALLIGVFILGIVIVQQNNAAAEQAELTRINAICEENLVDPYGDDLEAMIACQDDLLAR